MTKGDDVKLHVAKRHLRRGQKVFGTAVATALVAFGGSAVAGATGHHQLAKDGVVVGWSAVAVEYGAVAALQKRKNAVRRFNTGSQDISGP